MPFIWIILFILWWTVSAISKNAQRQKTSGSARQAVPRPVRRPASGSQPLPWPDEEEDDGWENHRMPPVAHETAPAQAAPAAPPHQPRPLEAHMHAPVDVMGLEGEGTEGMDCCHDFMLDSQAPEPSADFLPMGQEDEQERARSLLQGVIFSEILGRRPARRYGGKAS